MEEVPLEMAQEVPTEATEVTEVAQEVKNPLHFSGINLEDLTQSPLQNPIKQPLTDDADTAAINKELQELYDVVSQKIRLSVANNQFTAESLEVILSKIVETLEDVSLAGAKHLSGIEKRNIGMNILRMVIKDLHDKGQISDELYSYFNLGLTYVAPALFYAAKESWKKIQEISADIAVNGCFGCRRKK